MKITGILLLVYCLGEPWPNMDLQIHESLLFFQSDISSNSQYLSPCMHFISLLSIIQIIAKLILFQ